MSAFLFCAHVWRNLAVMSMNPHLHALGGRGVHNEYLTMCNCVVLCNDLEKDFIVK